MAEKKDNAPVDETEDDIDIDLDYLLEEGLEATEKEEEEKKNPSKKIPVRKTAKKADSSEVKASAKKGSVKEEPSKSRGVSKKESEASEDKKSAEKKQKESSPRDKEVKSRSKAKMKNEPSEDVLVVDEEEGSYVAKLKPDIPEVVQSAMKQREYLKRRKPDFRRQEWFRYKRLGTAWRRPRGLHSKMRRHLKYRVNVVSIGYGTNRLVRGNHPSGFKEVLVYRPQDLEDMDPSIQAARIGHSVGSRKREMIEKRARELGIRILNRSG